MNNYQDVFIIETDELIEEYEYARDQYKRAVGDQQKDFWDGYLAGIEKLCGDAVISEIKNE